MKHTHKNHEIEVSTRDNGDFIEASAKFKPMTGYIGTFSIWGQTDRPRAPRRFSFAGRMKKPCSEGRGC